MRKDKLTLEDKMQRLRELSGININEGKVGTQSTLLDTTKAGKTTYAIVREGGSYYVKSTTSEIINESTLDYIGGLANKTKNKHSNYPDALKQLNLFKQNLDEGWGRVKTGSGRSPYEDEDAGSDCGCGEEDCEDCNESVNETEEVSEPEIIEEKMQKDIDPVGDQAPAAPMPPAGGMPQDPAMPPMPQDPAAAPEGMPQDPAGDAPMPEPAPMDAPMDEPEAEVGGAEGSPDEFGEEGEENQIDHLVGKLTAEIRETPEEELSEDKIKSILNSVISALPLKRVSPEERIKIARRVKNARKDGEEENSEDNVKPEGMPSGEPEGMPSAEPEMGGEPEGMPSAEPEIEKEKDPTLAEVELPISKLTPKPKTFNTKDDEKVNGFLNKNKNSMISESSKLKFNDVLIEAVGKDIVFNQGEKQYKFNVSEATINKFKNLLKK